MSVIDNVLVGRTHLMRWGALSAGLSMPWSRREERCTGRQRLRFLTSPACRDIADTPVGALAYGIRKKVELARAMSMEPRLLLLDEPVAGMSQSERAEVVALVRAIRERYDPTIVLVEHDMTTVMALAERILVLDFGRVIALGGPAEIQANPDVINAYLGKPEGLLAELGQECRRRTGGRAAMTTFALLLFAGLALGGVYALVALGFTVIYRASRVINFAQGELLALGAVVTAWLVSAHALPFWLAFAVGAVATAGAGLLFQFARAQVRHRQA